MTTAIEIASHAIRLCRMRDGAITELASWPIPEGGDPIAVLPAVLPDGLGPVRVLMHHDDLLLRPLTIGGVPDDRLERLIRFELGSLAAAGEEDARPDALAWHMPAVGGGDGEVRIMAQVVRRRLVDRLRAALSQRGAVLEGLTHPAVGLLETFRSQQSEHSGIACVLDVGGSHVHLALVKDGELVFLRSHNQGLDELVRQVSERRGISLADALPLVHNLTDGSPEDLKDLVAMHASQIAAAITANLRFCRSQLKLTDFEPDQLLVSGSGALAHGFLHVLSERSGLPLRLLNPFAGRELHLSGREADRLAGLPGPWAPVIGAAAGPLCIDALADERAARAHFWRTDGSLIVAAACVAAALLLAIILCERELSAQRQQVAALQESVPKAKERTKQLNELREANLKADARLRWVDGERRPGRIAVELLGVLVKQQDPVNCPVLITSYAVSHADGRTVVEISGGVTGGSVLPANALRTFIAGVRKDYPIITAVEEVPMRIEKDRLPFRTKLVIPD